MPDRAMGGPLPDDFAAQLARLMASGEVDAAAEVIAEATCLDDQGLAEFLERFATRVRLSGDPITAAELRALLRPGRD
jgi:hypothetical protein